MSYFLSIMSGISGSIIVSANMAIRPTQLKIASVTQGDLEFFRCLTSRFTSELVSC